VIEFVREWGALCVSVVSMGVAALAYWNSHRAVSVTTKEHEWKAKEREDAAARKAWCIDKAEILVIQSYGRAEVEISPDEVEWAKWGQEQGYFVLTRTILGIPCLRPRP
jgi:hypothetical protein